MFVRVFIKDDFLSKKIYSVPLKELLDFSDFIMLKVNKGIIKEVLKLNIQVEGPETIEDADFLLELQNAIKTSQSYVLTVFKQPIAQNELQKSSIFDNNVFDISCFVETKFDIEPGNISGALFLRYMFSNIIEKIMIEDDLWNYIFRCEMGGNELDIYKLSYGKDFAFDRTFKNYPSMMRCIKNTMKDF